MSSSVGRAPRFRFTLGQVMVLNIYLAATLAVVAPVMRIEGWADSLIAWFCVTSLLPMGLDLLTLALLRPSARRDGVRVTFSVLGGLSIMVWATLLAWAVYRKPTALSSGANPRQVRLWLTLTGTFFWVAWLAAAWRALRGVCPACRRSILVPPMSVRPATSRRTLIHVFAWCPACGRRWMRNRRAPAWADASDPSYDIGFGLSTNRAAATPAPPLDFPLPPVHHNGERTDPTPAGRPNIPPPEDHPP